MRFLPEWPRPFLEGGLPRETKGQARLRRGRIATPGRPGVAIRPRRKRACPFVSRGKPPSKKGRGHSGRNRMFSGPRGGSTVGGGGGAAGGAEARNAVILGHYRSIAQRGNTAVFPAGMLKTRGKRRPAPVNVQWKNLCFLGPVWGLSGAPTAPRAQSGAGMEAENRGASTRRRRGCMPEVSAAERRSPTSASANAGAPRRPPHSDFESGAGAGG